MESVTIWGVNGRGSDRFCNRSLTSFRGDDHDLGMKPSRREYTILDEARWPIPSAMMPDAKGVGAAWLYWRIFAARICCTICSGSVILCHGPFHVFGSGPIGKGSQVGEAGMSTLLIPPMVEVSVRILPIVWYIRGFFPA